MLTTFIEELCHKSPSAVVSVVDFIGAARAWHAVRGIPAPVRRHILAELRELGFPVGLKGSRQHIIGLAFERPKALKVEDGRVVKSSVAAPRKG